MLIKKIFGLCVAIMFDGGAALIIAYFFPLSGLAFFQACIELAIIILLPDIDIVFKLIQNRRHPDSTHREYFTHWPLAMIFIGLLGSLITNIFFQLPWIVVFIIPTCWLIHFIHDSVGCSGSLAWFMPLKGTHYWIITKPTSGIGSHRIIIKKERSPIVPLDEWLKNYYQLTMESFFSWLFFMIGIALFMIKI